MRTIWKYYIEPGRNEILMPGYAEILSVQLQREKVCIWALVNPEEEKVRRIFYTYGTGSEILTKSDLVFIGTFQIEGGALVFHLFEEIKNNIKFGGVDLSQQHY